MIIFKFLRNLYISTLMNLKYNLNIN